ncbi:hydroxyphenylacetyl-CoA thioesterase PaaI [Streptomyces sp. NPDC048392]|uniref:hydroxyphenylacetyl-CoA thioesterase PaaI n=1 Tax=Streptomyces sp. NPDC048392 TaxID=3365543 RepID=UPI00371AE484
MFGRETRVVGEVSQATGQTPTEAMFAADEASRGLGIELVEHGEGAAVVRMTVTPAMVNGHRIAHGGFLFLLADTAFACACNSRGPVTVAAGADIVFVAPAREGDVLVARAEERARYGRSGIYDVSVRRGDEVIAEFRGRSRSVLEDRRSRGVRDDTARETPGTTTKESR